MASQRVLVVLAIGCMLLQLAQVIQGACVCNEKGTDYCAGCNERLVVRPKQKYSNGDVGLAPIGDNCWCSKLMIEPAALPKPPCPKHNTPTCSCNSQSNEQAAPGPYMDQYANQIKSVKDSPPADPISVSLAMQAGKAIEVPEAKVSFGFYQKPVDGQKKIYFSNVPEENLFKLRSDVITLKKRPQRVQREEEEWVEEEEEAAPAEDDEQPYLSYKELGYEAEKFKNPKFREITSSYVVDEAEAPGTPVQGKVSVDCGFKPGRISPYRRIQSRSDINDCFQNY